MQQTESAQQKVSRLRALNETEKLSLIFTQQRKMSEFQERLEAFNCAHQAGTCALCQDKNLTIAHLQQQIERLKDKLYGRSSERSNKKDDDDKNKSKNSGDDGNDGKKGAGEKRTRLPSEQFPNARIEECILQDATPPECDQCTQPMSDSGMRETSERLEYQPADVYILRTQRVRYHCKCCHSAPKTAALPERMAPGSSLGDSFIIQACISKFYDLIPTSRFAKILARGNAAVSHSLILKAQSIMAFVLVSLYRLIKKEILHSGLVFADETIHRQLEQNNGNWRWYLWGFSNQNSIYFEIHNTRSGDVSIEFLIKSLVHFLVSDAYTGYERTIREVNEFRKANKLPLLQSCLCNDHSRRYFFYAQAAVLAQKALDVYDEIYKIERQVQKLLKNPQYQELENSGKALELRQTADPLFNQIYDISCEILLSSPEKSLEATAAKYFLNHVQGLTLFLRHIELPISNAPAERGIRDGVLLRKTALGNHSKAGADEASILLSVMGSCKMAGVNPTEFLEFTRTKYLAKEPLITPHQYKLHKALLRKEKPPDNS